MGAAYHKRDDASERTTKNLTNTDDKWFGSNKIMKHITQNVAKTVGDLQQNK
jgi:hypothetical protein